MHNNKAKTYSIKETNSGKPLPVKFWGLHYYATKISYRIVLSIQI